MNKESKSNSHKTSRDFLFFKKKKTRYTFTVIQVVDDILCFEIKKKVPTYQKKSRESRAERLRKEGDNFFPACNNGSNSINQSAFNPLKKPQRQQKKTLTNFRAKPQRLSELVSLSLPLFSLSKSAE